MFDKFISLSHLYNSYYLAYKGRKKSKEVIQYKQNLEENISKLRNKIISFTYEHSKYKTFIVEDSKKRIINAPSFEDHILHHAVFNLLEEVFDKKFIFHSYANRKEKGSHKAVLTLQKESRKYSYFLKLDITKYFGSVNQEILYFQIQKHIKDENFLFYIKMILNSHKETLSSNLTSPVFKGMPIGNVTSQLFANIYLHDLDFYVEYTLKPIFRKQNKDLFYVRYVDDFIFLTKDKQDLIFIKNLVLNFLNEKLKLIVHPRKMILNKINCRIPFLGYVIFRNKLKIRNDTIRRFNKRIKNYENKRKLNSIISFKGHSDLADINLINAIAKKNLDKKDYDFFVNCSIRKLLHTSLTLVFDFTHLAIFIDIY